MKTSDASRMQSIICTCATSNNKNAHTHSHKQCSTAMPSRPLFVSVCKVAGRCVARRSLRQPLNLDKCIARPTGQKRGAAPHFGVSEWSEQTRSGTAERYHVRAPHIERKYLHSSSSCLPLGNLASEIATTKKNSKSGNNMRVRLWWVCVCVCFSTAMFATVAEKYVYLEIYQQES